MVQVIHLANRCYISTIAMPFTGPIGYSDSAGKPKKFRCKQLSLCRMIFSLSRSFLGPKNCHCSRIVTLTSVTDRACGVNLIGYDMNLLKTKCSHSLFKRPRRSSFPVSTSKMQLIALAHLEIWPHLPITLAANLLRIPFYARKIKMSADGP